MGDSKVHQMWAGSANITSWHDVEILLYISNYKCLTYMLLQARNHMPSKYQIWQCECQQKPMPINLNQIFEVENTKYNVENILF